MNEATLALLRRINETPEWRSTVFGDLAQVAWSDPDGDPETAGDVIRENTEDMLRRIADAGHQSTLSEVGDLDRVDWTELGRHFLSEWGTD